MNMRKSNEEQPAGRQKRKFRLSGLIYHNSFVLACSFLAALIGWFITAAGSSDLNRTVYNVPIQFTMSAEAEADGLRVWGSSYQTVDIEVSGSTMITSKLTAEDFEVTAALNPTSTKLTGNTTQKAAAQVHVAKKSTYSDYEVVSISPEEITLEYDRYKEVRGHRFLSGHAGALCREGDYKRPRVLCKQDKPRGGGLQRGRGTSGE